ncbi:MAG TPA: MFS transporter [Candidatus Onthocola gallistercoris]|uniref:MFS transporter n=1 Tax=Candidatus Onthocola gallistercoris TaxID=2840876 RepID=A0A9D1HJ68_9FIRM|nr:MFS transporter [Candidatus Onthocola gallistercoris]
MLWEEGGSVTSDWKKKFVVIYAGQAFSLLGSAAVQFAVIWWLTVQTGSAITLALATIVSCLPNMIIGSFAGVWVDKYNRRTVMIGADGLVALSSLILGAAFMISRTPLVGLVYIILFLRGLGNTFHAPAMQAAIPLFVPTDKLSKAGGWGNLITSISAMAGPVSETVGVAGWFWVSGILMAASGLVCFLATRRYDGSSGCGSDGRKKD